MAKVERTDAAPIEAINRTKNVQVGTFSEQGFDDGGTLDTGTAPQRQVDTQRVGEGGAALGTGTAAPIRGEQTTGQPEGDQTLDTTQPQAPPTGIRSEGDGQVLGETGGVVEQTGQELVGGRGCLLYTSPSPRD